VFLGALSLALCLTSWAIHGGPLGPSRAAATDVTGKLKGGKALKRPTPQPSVRPPYWDEWNGFSPPAVRTAARLRDVAIALVPAEPDQPRRLTLKLENGAAAQGTLVTQVGSQLRVQNSDLFAHALHASKMKNFQKVEISPGNSRHVDLMEEGYFLLTDPLAPHIVVHLHVLPSMSRSGYPDRKGRFEFKRAKPGNYTVKVYNGAEEVGSQAVTVPDQGEVKLDALDLVAMAARRDAAKEK